MDAGTVEMNAQVYYRFSLALPLVMSLIAAGTLRLGYYGAVPVFLTLALVFGGVPYSVLALITLWWSRGKSEQKIFRASLIAPLLMIPFAWMYLLIYLLVSRQFSAGAVIYFCGLACLFSVVLGYAYVILVNAGLRLFQRLGWVR